MFLVTLCALIPYPVLAWALCVVVVVTAVPQSCTRYFHLLCMHSLSVEQPRLPGGIILNVLCPSLGTVS